MPTAADVLRAVDDIISDGVRRGMLHNVAEDDRLDGRIVTVRGRRLVNFGSCSYLGLETHPALAEAVTDAVTRYGTQFSSSRAYLSSPAYTEAESLLSEVFGRPTLITPSTTLGHMAAMPTLIGVNDALLLDHQVHASVQTAAKLAQAQGTLVELVPHSDLEKLAARVAELSRTHDRIWYAGDGLYSMYADFAPVDALCRMVEEFPKLWLYLDDAHGASWTGKNGRGHVLDRLTPAAAERTLVAASLNKSFAAAGGALTFPTEELLRQVRTVGGPMIFSGPVQPPMLGAVIASARWHLSPAVTERQERLQASIRLFNRLAEEQGLPLVSVDESPIRYIAAGGPPVAYNLTGRLLDAGFFVDTASYPAVAAKRSGARVTLTYHHTDADIVALVDAIAAALPAALADEGSSAEELVSVFSRQLAGRPVRLRPVPVAPAIPLRAMDSVESAPSADGELRLERHDTIGTVDRDEWDRMLAGRGAFGWAALRTFERAFDGDPASDPQGWRFTYWIVRDASDAPVAATFFTTACWKDDMLSTVEVSAEVERRRAELPMYLTSTVVGMGSLITEGDHLWLDRSADWRAALRLLLTAARTEEEKVGASALALRDLEDDGSPEAQELHDFLVGEGFLRLPTMPTWERELDFADDTQFLAGLAKKARYHQRTAVLSWEDRYQVENIVGGSSAAAALTTAERDHLYRLYRNVHARNLELNVFPLPRRLFDEVLAESCWELALLRLTDGPDEPIAFALLYHGPEHVAPVFVGLDYTYVASHRSYQQTLWQTFRTGQRRGAKRLLLGMSADLQKSRFGARPRRRVVYLQPTEQYQADVLNQLTEAIAAQAA
ncbi:aminotransferase class I/II-fold pyridoxal phosphate-dependent enzyme [Cryptosporangium aurantiacum]|uniref:8-amino-7-oxononanoate synthase n=1 Tax=Cryptosporangium aurantiacum TaxID=134849 RepID=A0A1M7K3F2_9ACTN|nr:aminotransferase class I/II-fold pyridoxal phosphate-dependent enzyme [Cryptosporangium aurantiacum]SHM59691.1 7-keto-8-aminopelargonate synthetase [Cryptosporangium aurantiacum]